MTDHTITLQLIHGRHEPNAAPCNWVFDAKPITGISFLHSAYLSTLTVGFTSRQALEAAMSYTGWKIWDELILEVSLHGDLIRCGGDYYGDFEIYLEPLTIVASLSPDSS